MASPSPTTRWLVEHGPKELALLFRAIVNHPAAPIHITDDDHNYERAAESTGRLLGHSRETLTGPQTAGLMQPGGNPQASRGFDNMEAAETEEPSPADIPLWMREYALYLLDSEGCVAAWYSSAARIYGYPARKALGQHVSFLYPGEEALPVKLQEEFNRAAAEGHMGTEQWQAKQDGSRFWANAITMALKDEHGQLHGFARVVRDFSERQQKYEILRSKRARRLPNSSHAAIPGIIGGEFDRITEVNDAFLQIVGYTREDWRAGILHWPDLTPPEYAALDEFAHEEALRFGACTAFEKKLIRKDRARVSVMVATAVLKVAPLRWITFVQEVPDRDRLETLEDEGDHVPQPDFEEMVGNSPALREVQRLIQLVAPTDSSVLILGETGTGKELVARAIHKISVRKHAPFITLNCAAIPTGLLESELFGYERGAFTGALSQKMGRFEMAHQGTLFLDEVGDIPLELQPKLLRALQEKAFERLGGTKTIPIDVRLVTATNRNLPQMISEKLFRSDLYYRLKVFPITTPPLRSHTEDIPLLAWHFTKKYAAQMRRQIDRIPSDVMRAMCAWPWPGNIRELENFIERSVILSQGPSLCAPLADIWPGEAESLGITLEQVEREHVLRVLREANGVVTTAASRLGLPRTTLNAIMRRHGISRKDL